MFFDMLSKLKLIFNAKLVEDLEVDDHIWNDEEGTKKRLLVSTVFIWSCWQIWPADRWRRRSFQMTVLCPVPTTFSGIERFQESFQIRLWIFVRSNMHARMRWYVNIDFTLHRFGKQSSNRRHQAAHRPTTWNARSRVFCFCMACLLVLELCDNYEGRNVMISIIMNFNV